MDIKTYVQNLSKFINEKKNKPLLLTAETTSVISGEAPSYDKNMCDRHGLAVLETRHAGGTLVMFKNDLNIVNFSASQDDNYGFMIIDKLIKYLEDKGIQVTYENNDILIDGYKTISWMSVFIDDCLYTGVHIPFNIDVKLIRDICTKPMEKVPKGLDEFGIDRGDLINYIQEEIINVESTL